MKVFNYLAKAMYPTLILWALNLYYSANAETIYSSETSTALIVLACLFGAVAIIGIVGKLVLTIMETVKECKAKKNGGTNKE